MNWSWASGENESNMDHNAMSFRSICVYWWKLMRHRIHEYQFLCMHTAAARDWFHALLRTVTSICIATFGLKMTETIMSSSRLPHPILSLTRTFQIKKHVRSAYFFIIKISEVIFMENRTVNVPGSGQRLPRHNRRCTSPGQRLQTPGRKCQQPVKTKRFFYE